MSTSVSATEARAALPEILDRVESGEEVTITRHGKPAAIVVRPDRLRARRADQAMAAAERLREALAQGRTRPLTNAPGVKLARVDALVDSLRDSRTRR